MNKFDDYTCSAEIEVICEDNEQLNLQELINEVNTGELDDMADMNLARLLQKLSAQEITQGQLKKLIQCLQDATITREPFNDEDDEGFYCGEDSLIILSDANVALTEEVLDVYLRDPEKFYNRIMATYHDFTKSMSAETRQSALLSALEDLHSQQRPSF